MTAHAAPRVALVHDWTLGYAGSERVLEQLIALFPEADVFCVADLAPEGQRAFFQGRKPRTTFIQRLPAVRRLIQRYLPLMPLAVESLDLSAYQVVISSSHAVAKGVITAPDQVHFCYCHTPLRYAWDLSHQYLEESGYTKGVRRALAMAVLHYMRLWDVRTAHGVDHFIANSRFVAGRIRKAYGRDSYVLHPPVDLGQFTLCEDKEDYYLAASRLVLYKRMEVVVEAFSAIPSKRLLVVGDGPARARCERIAGPNVEFLGHVSAAELKRLMQRARAFVFAALEDFGIVLAEAQACGTPVLCYGRGGALDIVVPCVTGLFFETQTPEAVREAVERFEDNSEEFRPAVIRRHALRFGIDDFRRGFMEIYEKHAPLAARTSAALEMFSLARGRIE